MKTTMTLFLTAASWLFASVPAGQAGTTSAIQPERVGDGAYPDLAADAGGGLHLVYVRDGALYYRHRPAGAQVWEPEQATGLRAENPHRSDPEVAVDSRRQPHVLVGRSYAWRENGVWKALDPGVERDTAMAIDGQDNVFICRRGGAHGGFLGLRQRHAGADRFKDLPDPDVAGGLPKGQNDHVYSHLFISPRDQSVHVVYRHGAPSRCAYRVSTNGGLTWAGGGISDDDLEAPSGLALADGTIYVISGNGTVHERVGGPGEWRSSGRALSSGRRDLPVLAADGAGNLYAAGFGGRWNVRVNGRWTGEQRLPAPRGQSLGFVALTSTPDGRVWACWEEGNQVNQEQVAGTSGLWLAQLGPEAARANAESPRPATEVTPPRALAQVKQWDRFEMAVDSPRTYPDPFRDVSLEATFTRPDGSTVKFWGYYDGGQTWRVRFMPDQVGRWQVRATFSDGAMTREDEFECVPSDLPGMIAVHKPNPVWFGYQNGPAVLLRGLHVGDRYFARNFPSAQRLAFLDWVQTNGYNLLSVASHYLNRNAPGRGRGWQTPELWPLNPAEFAWLEAQLAELADRRLLVYPFAGFFGRDSNFPRQPQDQELFVRYTYARLGAFWNLLLNVAGPEPLLRERPYLTREEVNRLGVLVQTQNVFGKPLSVHNRTGDDEFRDEPWLTYGTLQGPKTGHRAHLARGLLESHHPAKPLLAQETLWSGNTYHIRGMKRDYTDDELRKNTFVIHFCAAALVFADNDGDSSTGFSGTLDVAACKPNRHAAVKRAWDLCATLPFAGLKPRPDLVKGEHAHCLAEPGRMFLVYLETSQPVTVRVGDGAWRATWIDTRPPYPRQNGGVIQDERPLTPPPGGDDWVLQLTPAASKTE